MSANVKTGPNRGAHTALIVVMDVGSSAVCQTITKRLVRSVASSATSTIAAAVATPGREAAAAPSTEVAAATASAEGTSATSAATRHARNIRTLGNDLDVATLEDTLVEDKGLGD